MPVKHTACNLCEAICGLLVTVEDGRVTDIRGDEDDPLSRGHICPKAVALRDLQDDPDRLRGPVVRRGQTWAEVSWREAVDVAAAGIAGAQAKYGADAVGTYLGNPNVHSLGGLTHAPAFVQLLGSRNKFTATSVDQLPHMLVSHLLYGHQLMIPVPDIDRSSYLLMLGANPVASNGSIMTAPGMRRRLRDLQARGGRVVVIDPRRTESAAVADEHHFIRPGTDAAFLLAVVRQLVDEQAVRVAEYVDGVDAVREAVREWTPERAAGITGIEATHIRRIAREFAEADGAACYGRIGISTQRLGTVCQWAVQVINILSGNLDRPGGTIFARPAIDALRGMGPGHLGTYRSRVRGLPEFSGDLPVAALAEEILTPGDGRIRAMITVAGNPVLSAPNGNRLDEAFANLDFMVAIDPYLNETTRHADVILPPTPPLEREHYDILFHQLAVRNTSRWNDAVLPKAPDSRHDWEIFRDLASAYRKKAKLMRNRRRFLPALRLSSPLQLTPRRIVGLGLLIGPYRLNLRKLRAQPSGVDLGPLRPALPAVLRTPHKRIDVAPRLLLADLPRAARLLDESRPADGEILLIGRRHLRSNNSWMHNTPRLVKGRPRHHLLMNPADLDARGLTDGQRVRVTSATGAIEVEVAATEDVMVGVASLPHGFGQRREGTRQRVADRVAGASINDLTDAARLDDVAGTAAFSGVPVMVTSLSQPPLTTITPNGKSSKS